MLELSGFQLETVESLVTTALAILELCNVRQLDKKDIWLVRLFTDLLRLDGWLVLWHVGLFTAKVSFFFVSNYMVWNNYSSYN